MERDGNASLEQTSAFSLGPKLGSEFRLANLQCSVPHRSREASLGFSFDHPVLEQ